MLHIPGLIAIMTYYVLILGVGLWEARKSKTSLSRQMLYSEDLMLARRNVGVLVGICTLTATWVSGDYINGTAEIIARDGLIWCQTPFGNSLSLVLGGLFFARRMREQRYVTMLDPFQSKYGVRMGGLLYIPAFLGEIFWSAATLSSIGETLAAIINLNNLITITVTACVVITYTLLGGLYSVIYTHVIQFVFVFVGLWVSFPFALTNKAVGSLSGNASMVLSNEIPPRSIGVYIDTLLLLIFGGIPWQLYFQRVLSLQSAYWAELLSYVAAFGCLMMSVPVIMMGVIAAVTDWNQTLYSGDIPIPAEGYKLILPMVLQYLCPGIITFLGLGAICAAALSSLDASILSASSMFARNVYKRIFRQKASEQDIIWVMRVSIIALGLLATSIGMTTTSSSGLFYLSSDFVYVILFPQLVCVIYCEDSNTYGSLLGYVISFFVRIAGGESLIHLPAAIQFPGYDEKQNRQYFPFRTLAMLSNLVVVIGVSKLTKCLFDRGIISPRYDIFLAVIKSKEETTVLTPQSDSHSRTMKDAPLATKTLPQSNKRSSTKSKMPRPNVLAKKKNLDS